MNDLYDDYLEHHGVMGMKWGQRNAETLRKYGLAGGHTTKKAAKTVGSAVKTAGSASVRKVSLAGGKAVTYVKTKHDARKNMSYDEKLDKRRSHMTKRGAKRDNERALKRINTMSNEELRARINRMNLEAEYLRAVKSNQKPSRSKRFGSYIGQKTMKMVDTALDTTATNLGRSFANQVTATPNARAKAIMSREKQRMDAFYVPKGNKQNKSSSNAETKPTKESPLQNKVVNKVEVQKVMKTKTPPETSEYLKSLYKESYENLLDDGR